LNGLRIKRKEKKWNAEELAAKVGCSAQMIYLIERGEANPSLELLKKIAEVLECKIDDLL
jgi:transcriptional regulator with XRE-family HTH domain